MADPGVVDLAALATSDAAARLRALDVARSFLVQAPAGSGKTGLLIQRYLALLAIAERPEKIVAMTFTRKAAAEMRERVLAALRDAAAALPVDPAGAHDLRTRELALAVLRRDAERGWSLLAQPARLRMLTIDAMSAALARQAPVATGLGALPAFVDDALPLYVEAVTDALAAAGADDPAWRRFLAHVDNDATQAVDLIARLLGQREQWMRLVGRGDAGLRTALERTLRIEVEGALAAARAAMPAARVAPLVALAAFAAGNLDDDAAALRDPLRRIAAARALPQAAAVALPDWQALADWLLRKNDPAWRQRVDRNGGFPAKGGSGAESALRERQKEAFAAWVRDAAAVPGLARALDEVRHLPPLRFDDAAWTFVEATLALLRQCAAHLQLVFARRGQSDFAEATLRALAALGDADDPGELLLAMDYRIDHLLVDEFQDTSVAQLQLVERLTSGWTAGDGRTLFVVGDPMQSIYRFREAEVAIFVAAQASGRIGAIDVECLELARNFRSQRPLVDWVNRVFAQVLPTPADVSRGEVGYKPELAARGDGDGGAPTVDLVAAADEAAATVDRVRAALAAGAPSIAVLARARRHLDAILPALRAAGIPFTAVDLESLAERLATRDLGTLTRTLSQPADRLAALAALRAPWCGLALADLYALAQAARERTIVAAAADPDVAARLSADGRAALARVLPVLLRAESARGRQSLVERVRGAWLALGGAACGEGDVDLAGAERFFALLALHERGGDVPDWDAFAAAAAGLYAEPATTAVVQVMTLHKAKGLEFDTVILPGLARGTAGDGASALRWRQRTPYAEAGLLLAPMRARAGARGEDDPVYAYLKRLARDEADAELGRLLYVGCTRAQRRLHLIAAPSPERRSPDAAPTWSAPARSAFARLQPALALPAPSLPAAGADADAPAAAPERRAPPLARLPAGWGPPPYEPVPVAAAAATRAAPAPAFDWARATAAAIGTVAHRRLAQLAREGIAAWAPRRIDAAGARIRAELRGEGVAADELDRATASVQHALRGVVASDRGRWLFAAGHADARSEWALAGVVDGAVVHVALDRTFVADGVRWIVDFKTGAHEGADRDGFLAREVERYRPQLERYAALVAALDARPLRLALFYPLIDGWREWAWTGAAVAAGEGAAGPEIG